MERDESVNIFSSQDYHYLNITINLYSNKYLVLDVHIRTTGNKSIFREEFVSEMT